jgi:2-oxoisovalerate dehydrogenase E1 component alpha subunit
MTSHKGQKEVEAQRQVDPIRRFQKYLELKGWWTKEEETLHKDKVKKEIRQALAKAEVRDKPALSEIFKDVYDEITPALREQKEELAAHLEKYRDSYPKNHGPL